MTFHDTRWSLILAAADSADFDRSALNSLCELYWQPVYAFIRRQGYDATAAEDLTQGFFEKLIEKKYLAQADRQRGRFRSFLLTSVKHFMANERDRDRAQKRGGGIIHVSVSAATNEENGLNPEEIFEKRAAFATLDAALAKLRAEYAGNSALPLFERLVPFLTGNTPDDSYDEAAKELGMTSGAVRVAVHRMRSRFRGALRDLVASTLAQASDVDAEIRHFLDVIAL